MKHIWCNVDDGIKRNISVEVKWRGHHDELSIAPSLHLKHLQTYRPCFVKAISGNFLLHPNIISWHIFFQNIREKHGFTVINSSWHICYCLCLNLTSDKLWNNIISKNVLSIFQWKHKNKYLVKNGWYILKQNSICVIYRSWLDKSMFTTGRTRMG